MAKQEIEKETIVAPEAPKSNVWKWLMIFFIIIVLLGGAGFGVYEFVIKKPTAEAVKKEPAPVSAMYAMEPFVVNLMDDQGGRYLKVVIQLEVNDEKIVPELNRIKPKLRDAVLDLLSAKSFKDLMDPAGKQQLREEVVLRLNAHLTEGKVLKVFFTEFVVQ
ncbi:MAG: flagellar basal body-associated protein FliL [Smithellaceae bacterium]|nr:flagellar basal body-associated protein FliL [Smithellaceae bacterium]